MEDDAYKFFIRTTSDGKYYIVVKHPNSHNFYPLKKTEEFDFSGISLSHASLDKILDWDTGPLKFCSYEEACIYGQIQGWMHCEDLDEI